MTWKVRTVDASAERALITGLIVSDQFAKTILPMLRPELIEAPFAKIVADWCSDYYKRYEKTPGPVIQEIYEGNVDQLEESVAESIKMFLSDLSSKYDESFNVEYMVDKTEEYLKKRGLEQLGADIKANLVKGKVSDAESLIAQFKRVERYSGDTIDVLNDRQAIIDAFHEEEEILFCLPGDLGKLVKPFCRGDLIAVAAPGKRGKTWWLQEIGIRALFAGLKVAFFSLEMSKSQMIRRFYQSILGEPRRVIEDEEHALVDIPYFDVEGNIQMRQVPKTGLSVDKALRKVKSFKKMVKSGSFRLLCFPAHSLGHRGLATELDNLEYYSDFIPDVVIIDYADYMMPEIRADIRHQIDDTWKNLRGQALKRHLLLVTATHTNKATYSRDIGQDDLSEDSRKLNHVACMFALNQTPDEKRAGYMRASILASRHELFDIDEEVIILNNLSIGKPYLDSRFKRFVRGV